MGCCSNRCFSLLLILCGVGLSGYAYYVELQSEENPDYKALCDINEEISCTKVFNSEYGTGFGLVQKFVDKDHWLVQRNPIYGFVVYGILAFCALFNIKFFAKIQLYLSVVCNIGSVYLGYILYFVLKDICVVCFSTYLVNFLILICSFLKVRSLRPSRQHESFDVNKRHSNFNLPTHNFKKNI